MSSNLKAYLAELIGTFALVFAAAGAACMDVVTGGRLGPIGLALAYGGAAAAMMTAFGPISGGHFNPAATAAMLVNRRIGPIQGIFYIVSQLLGAALAGIFLKASLHNYPQLLTASPYLGACDLADVGFKAGTLLEAVATFFLVSTLYATTVDPRGSSRSPALSAGLTIAVGVLVIGPLTGAALNPARAFGPAVATGHWANAFVYWIGPVIGGAVAALLYENLFLQTKD